MVTNSTIINKTTDHIPTWVLLNLLNWVEIA